MCCKYLSYCSRLQSASIPFIIHHQQSASNPFITTNSLNQIHSSSTNSLHQIHSSSTTNSLHQIHSSTTNSLHQIHSSPPPTTVCIKSIHHPPPTVCIKSILHQSASNPLIHPPPTVCIKSIYQPPPTACIKSIHHNISLHQIYSLTVFLPFCSFVSSVIFMFFHVLFFLKNLFVRIIGGSLGVTRNVP